MTIKWIFNINFTVLKHVKTNILGKEMCFEFIKPLRTQELILL